MLIGSDICDQYISYALQLLKEDTINQEEVRKTFEEVLDIWGAHFTKGFALWDRYLHFEKDIQIKLLEESMAEGKEQKEYIYIYIYKLVQKMRGL